MEFIATCPKGFEKLLAEELASFHIPQVRQLRGQVAFGGELADAYRACLWSRLASRVLLVLARVGAADADALYEGVQSIDWSAHLAPGATFVIDSHGTNDNLRNTQFVALRSKDAISDQLFSARGMRPVVNTDAPDVIVDVRLQRERATVSIDLTGEPLFHRGYDSRAARKVAPLRADYAAMVLAAGRWYRNVRHGAPVLAALWAGQGAVLVEAAAEALDRAPGLLRARWGFEGWAGHDADAWDELLAEADERATAGERNSLALYACDTRPGAEAACRGALRAAGLDCELTFAPAAEVLDAARAAGDDALVTCDLSWLSEDDLALEASALTAMSAAAGMNVAALVRDSSVDAAVQAAPAEVFDVIQGREPAYVRCFDAVPGQAAPEPACVTLAGGERVPVLVPASDQFAARLAKVAKLRAKWARREDVSCYRVYDADLPDYAVAIELYQGLDGKGRWLQVSEYAAPKEIDADLARRRLMDVLAIAPRVMGIDPSNVNLRVRTRARGGSQYADEGSAAATPAAGEFSRLRGQRADMRNRHKPSLTDLPRGAHLIDEGGLTFEVNFSARLDCGIFLDHRDTRAEVREMMKKTLGSKRFLNLFAYTGTATCYAADGGAKFTTTVDLSRPSLDWARRNMARNGFTGPEHEFVQADVIQWVSEQRHTRNRWDLVFCDVPTFSNSQRMKKSSWDVQRDHSELIIGVSRLLTRNGCAIFSCNLRGFKPDVEALQKAGVVIEDITASTIPEDFKRNAKIHHAYIVRRG
ncbi:MAG: bifunctional 23S rRNA (guanine(2069)-N(7))-methyltransferase RlmK/23S rRNA (guanine(2445)-N(2))-methyltransferase RlmL [Coriobacteriia bacterium]|nr:MAG: bifunctional 23S rRNA (guanine(2069)-N(7))-methyltransferase RlmK/23S rRNA (guanine(2445)-N(2))-methyltransferase RlmL [Coriobacteriia bacterium]